LDAKIHGELITVKGGQHGGRALYEEAMLKKVAGFLASGD
jgi:hypothetical protein